MTTSTWLAVAVAGGLGALARYVVDLTVTARAHLAFPLGTLVVNVTGSLGAGVLAGLAADAGIGPEVHTVVAGGFLGAYTTFSTAMFRSLTLWEDRTRWVALADLLLQLVASVVAAGLGWALAG